MKLSMMSYTMTRQREHFDFDDMLKLTRELDMAGIDFVGLCGRTAAEARERADDYGRPVVCHTFMVDLNFPGRGGRQPGLDKARSHIEDAVTLGAPLVMLPTPPKKGVDRETSRSNWIKGLCDLAPFAEDAGVTMTVENFPGKKSPFVIAADMLEAVREVPGLKIAFDNGNAAEGEDPVASFKKCAEHVVHAHFKDKYFRDEPGEGYRETLSGKYVKPALIGEGDVEQRGCLAAMVENGYEGCINIEYEGNEYTPADGVRRAVDYLRGLEQAL